MKISGSWLSLWLASIACASAQVTVEVTQDQQQFLAGEALKVTVRITNLSGQALRLGDEEDWLTFALESREGIVLPKIGEAPVLGAFTLESSKAAIKRVDLAPYFTVTQPGAYQIVATVHIRGWSGELTSPPTTFHLIQGSKLWEQEVGVPGSAAVTNGQPEIRRYTLQQANYIRGQIRLYLRVTDAYAKPIRVLAIGPMVSFGRPEPQIDRSSNLHVLCQEGPFSFSYTVCNLQGDVIARQTYDYSETRPRLRLDDDGNISVVGGTRHIAANDVPGAPQEDLDVPALPPLLPEPLTNQVSVTKPSNPSK